jgi:glycosyltransferase involved in cell wall biosynthesis
VKISIITPTVQRQSLLKTCQSVNSQTFTDWEHIVQIDMEILNLDLIMGIDHQQRRIFQCKHPHRNGGNACRNIAWTHAKGDYVYYLDDDNFLADNNVLADVAAALESNNSPHWAMFPILRHGYRFFNDPPAHCAVDTGNVIAKREICQWPDVMTYESDWVLVEILLKYPRVGFPNIRPIMVMPYSSGCKVEE